MTKFQKAAAALLIAFNVATAGNILRTEYANGFQDRPDGSDEVLALSWAKAAGRSVHRAVGPGPAGDLAAGAAEVAVGVPTFVAGMPGAFVGSGLKVMGQLGKME